MIYLEVDGNEVDVEFHSFSGGERNVKIKGLSPRMSQEFYNGYIVVAKITCPEDIFDLLLLKDALDRHTNISLRSAKNVLVMPYLPYARQDRPMVVGESLAVKVMADLVNGLNFDTVLVNDVHSHVGMSLLKGAVELSQSELAFNFFQRTAKVNLADYVLCAPDAGALKKVYELAELMGGAEIAVGQKHRDTRTGKITGTSFSGADVKDKKVLMVDDICDGGATFTFLGQVLKGAGASQVDLYVTHGIFSKGIDDVFDGVVDNVYALMPWEKYVEGKNTKNILKLFDNEPLFK